MPNAEEDAAMTLSGIPAIVLGKYVVIEHTDGPERPSRGEIARLAYEFYEMRGRRDGHDVDDWLSAERELRHHYQ
jgi:hypothetical protein